MLSRTRVWALGFFFLAAAGGSNPAGGERVTTASLSVPAAAFPNPEISVRPNALQVVLAPGEATTRTVTIGNVGDGDLLFEARAFERSRSLYPDGVSTVVLPAGAKENPPGDTIVLDYEFPDPVVGKVRDLAGQAPPYDLLTVPGLDFLRRGGAPLVPARPARVLIPPGKTVAALRVVCSGAEEWPGPWLLLPAERPYPLDGTMSEAGWKPAPQAELTPPDPEIYGGAETWPAADYEDLGVQSKRGYQVLFLNLFPLRYVPATGAATLRSRMRLEVELRDAGAGDAAALRPTADARAAVASMVDNPEALEFYPFPSSVASSPVNPSQVSHLPSGGPFEYVIVTSGTLADAGGPWNFQALRDQKIARGISATIVKLEYIYRNYDGTRPDGGQDNPTRIRNFLMDAYQNWGTRYALLGGAAGVAPVRYFRVRSAPGGQTTDMPVDMYYGCVDPAACTFDEDRDGIYGETNDGVGRKDVDLLAEIIVGRAPVATQKELENFIRKTLEYASSSGDYLSTVTMVGEYLGFTGLSQFATGMLEQVRLGGTYDGYFTRGFENHEQRSFRPFDTSGNLYDRGLFPGLGGWPAIELVLRINKGVHVLNHVGLTNRFYAMKLTTADLSVLRNPDPFFVYSQGGNCGWFDQPDCFAETLLTIEHGAFAAVMNARTSFGAPDSTDSPSQRFNRAFWDAVFGDGVLEIGRANQLSKETLVARINEDAMRWIYYGLTLFGDPEQPFRFPLDCPWLRLQPRNGTVSPGGETELNIGFDADSLGPGRYEADVRIRNSDRNARVTTVAATLTVTNDDLFVLPGEPFVSLGVAGLPFQVRPRETTYTLDNVGVTSLTWTARSSEPWVNLVPESGVLGPGGSVRVGAGIASQAAGFPPGERSATLTFTNQGSGSWFERRVNLTLLEPGPAIALEWSAIPSPQAVKDTIPVTIRAVDANGFTAGSFQGPVEFKAGLRSLFRGNPAPRILLTEINTTFQDWVECANVTTGTIDISGWVFTAYDWHSWPAPSVSFTIPEGSVCGPNEIFLIYDEGVAPGAYPVFNVGANISWNNSDTDNEVAVLLRGETGKIADFVCGFGASADRIEAPIRIPDTEWNGRAFLANTDPFVTVHRIGQSDRNDYFDWDNHPPTPGTVADWMELPFVGLPVPLELGPTVSGLFTLGSWSGRIAIREPGRFIGVRARSLDGIEGLSNSFDIRFYAGFYPRILDYLLGKTALTEPERGRLDVNGDGVLNVADLLALKAVGAAGVRSGVDGVDQVDRVDNVDGVDDTEKLPENKGETTPATVMPDLVAHSIWREGSGAADTEIVKVSFRILNAGDRQTEECLYRLLLDGTSILEETLPVLEPGQDFVRQDFSLGQLRVGDYTVRVVADPTDTLEELKEGNNERTATLPVRIGPRTIQAASIPAYLPAPTVRVPILVTRAGAAAGVQVRIETDPAVFRVAGVSAPANAPPDFAVFWHSPAGAVTNIVVFPGFQEGMDGMDKMDGVDGTEGATEICSIQLETVFSRAPISSQVRVTLGAVSDRFGSASPEVTLIDGTIRFQAGAEGWGRYR